MSVDLSAIGDRLRRARLANGLSQVELAERLGWTRAAISRAERGSDLRVSTLVELARGLDLELTLVPRRFSSAVEILLEDHPALQTYQTAVYTGLGFEPYDEG